MLTDQDIERMTREELHQHCLKLDRLVNYSGPVMEPHEVIGWLRKSGLITAERAYSPQVGDVVLEVSSFRPDPTMIGTLNGVEENDVDGRIYHVTSWTGQKQQWLNCEARTIVANHFKKT